MAGSRFVVLGLALARSAWFRNVARWANSASIPVEFVKCVSPVEVRGHLRSGRPFSALLIDGGIPAVDRDLVDAARSIGCVVIVVDDLRVSCDWGSLGASAVVNPMFDRQDLLDVLATHAVMISRGDSLPGQPAETPTVGWRGTVAMVCGPGGTGASTVAIALAQGLSDDISHGGMVLLADLALHAEQGMLHDARDVVPGLQELVELHRAGRPSVDEVRALTFSVEARRYSLMLGLRRARHWGSLRPRAFEAAFETMTRGWRVIVCDTDSDLEGEDCGGSIDVEERHLMARTAARRADVVFAVGRCGMKGLHSVVRVIGDLHDHGVPSERIIPVLNQAPKNPRAKAELASALSALLAGRLDAARLSSPVFLPEKRVDDALRDGVRLPSALADPLTGAFRTVLERAGTRRAEDDEPVLVKPGSIGPWASATGAAERGGEGEEAGAAG